MRDELKNIERIEQYLQNTMSSEERSEFENELGNDKKLQEELALQESIVMGIKNAALKAEARKAYRRYKLIRNIKLWGGIGGIIFILAIAGYFMFRQPVENRPQIAPVDQQMPAINDEAADSVVKDTSAEEKLNAQPQVSRDEDTPIAPSVVLVDSVKNQKSKQRELQANEAAANTFLNSQYFTVNNQKDNVLETSDGIVMAIPALCFTGADGKPVAGDVKLEIIEALSSYDIMRAGLSTYAGKELLETGGMFYINATKDGIAVNIDPSNGIYAEIPADEKKPGMQLFDGKTMPEGTIDWVNPKPLEKFLLPMDVKSLNFYPPNYEDSLAVLTKGANSKKYKDSVYYSFSSLFTSVQLSREGVDTLREDGYNRKSGNKSSFSATRLTERLFGGGRDSKTNNTPEISGINPAKIRAIWNREFNTTFIATREFAERLQVIHRSCDNNLFDLYLNNLDKNLYEIDSMAAEMSPLFRKQFLEFAKRRETNVERLSPHLQNLKNYYLRKANEYTSEAYSKEKEFQRKNELAQQRFNDAVKRFNGKDQKRMTKNYNKEVAINMKEAYRQLGAIRRNVRRVSLSKNAATVTSTGWKNVDYYVYYGTGYRTTIDYTDPNNGKKAVIRYEPLSVSIKDRTNYDVVFVYAVPDLLRSYMRLKETDGVFTENLNELMKHELVCIGYKGTQAFVFYMENVAPGNYENIGLTAVTADELKAQLGEIKSSNAEKQLLVELEFRLKQQSENIRLKKLKDIVEFRRRIRVAIFPCERLRDEMYVR